MTRRFLSNNESGAIASYLISVVLVAILLIGGVLLLKGSSQADRSTSQTATISNPESTDTNQSNDKTADETKDEANNSGSSSADNSDKTNDTGTSQQTSLPSDITATGDTSDTSPATPETITATGPVEDFVGLLFGLLVAIGAVYAAWNYRLSRLAVKSALLNK